MKKLYSTLVLMTGLAGFSIASNANLFRIDEKTIYSEIASLYYLEEYISQHEGITRNDIISLSNSGNLHFNAAELGNCVSLAEPPLGIPSFLWGFTGALVGCCFGYGFWLGPAAVAGVYFLTDEDKDETKKAAYGCAAGGAVGFAIFFFYFATVLGLNLGGSI